MEIWLKLLLATKSRANTFPSKLPSVSTRLFNGVLSLPETRMKFGIKAASGGEKLRSSRFVPLTIVTTSVKILFLTGSHPKENVAPEFQTRSVCDRSAVPNALGLDAKYTSFWLGLVLIDRNRTAPCRVALASKLPVVIVTAACVVIANAAGIAKSIAFVFMSRCVRNFTAFEPL
jgi:hypothetical protein